MAFRLLSLLLCLLIAGLMGTPAWALAQPETRVGNIFQTSPKSAAADLALRLRCGVRNVHSQSVHLNAIAIYTHVNLQQLIEVHHLSRTAKLPPAQGGACQSADRSDIVSA